MTNPIRPKGPGTPLPTTSVESASTPKTSFSEVLNASKTSPTEKSQGAEALSGANAEIADGIRSGKLSPQQAVDALIEQALSAPEAASLSASSKQELSAMLRTAFAQDPTLTSMMNTKDTKGESNE